jgi:hypothetical protein
MEERSLYRPGLALLCGPGPVAQWIEQRFPKPRALVRFRSGVLPQPASEAGLAECSTDSGIGRLQHVCNQCRNRCDQLERRGAPEGEVGGAVDDAHVAAADLPSMR